MSPSRRFKYLFFLILTFTMFGCQRAAAFSLDLDSIAAMGKFPRFCIDVYRWGDKFFNTYDTAYVKSTGFKFNVKARGETWSDRYQFSLPNDYQMNMSSSPTVSAGLHLSYLAVSIGYDLNVNKIAGSTEPARNRFMFQFNCALFSAEISWMSNKEPTRIRSFGERGQMQSYNLRFDGINTDIFYLTAVYYLNNKRYSQASAFNYGRIQRRSQGSFFFGFNYWTQNFQFDFSGLPKSMLVQLPESWSEVGYKYNAHNRNYDLAVGYGYNWVFAPDWLIGISESPSFGLKSGYINYEGQNKYSFSLFNHARASIVWNKKHWFAGGILKVDNNLIYDKDHTLINTVLNGEIAVGYRFNLW